MPRFIFGLLLLCFTGTAWAATSLQSYAYQAELGASEQALQRVELPLALILQLTRADLGDIAVFNTSGKQLPHAVAQIPRSSEARVTILPFHEFSRFRRQHSRTVTTREQNQVGGSITELQRTETVPVQTRSNDYLIELVPAEDTPHFDRIELQWTHEPASQWLELKVETGNELDQLRVVQQRKSLTNLETKDISWRSISGLPRRQKYLRLTPAESITKFALQGVSGHYQEIQPAPKMSHVFTPEWVDEGDGRFYSFAFPSRVNAEALRILPGDEHSIISGDLYATWGKLDEKRRIRGGFRQHNISDAEVRPSEPIELRRGDLTRIWFRTDAELASAPRVELIYPQYEVVFLGDGNGPYRLAWGNYEVEPGRLDLRGLLDGNLQDASNRGATVALGKVDQAGGPARLAAQPALPWQKWLLWSLLVLVAIITGRMAWHLYREMHNGKQAQES